jgi:hypothetical protein
MDPTDTLAGLDIAPDETYVGEPEPVTPALPADDEPAAPPAPVAETPAPAPPADDDAHLVPVRIMVEERRRFQAQLDAANQRAAELEAAARAPKAPETPAPGEELPDFLEDPKGYIDAQTKTLAAEVERLRAANEALSAAATQEQQTRAFRSAVAETESAFHAANPKYYDALNHARDVREAQLRITNPEWSDTERRQVINNEENGLAMRGFQVGKPPPQMLWEYAQTLGYVPGGKAAPAPTQTAADDDLAARRAAAGTLGAGGGGEIAPEFEGQIDPLAQAMRERFGR